MYAASTYKITYLIHEHFLWGYFFQKFNILNTFLVHHYCIPSNLHVQWLQSCIIISCDWWRLSLNHAMLIQHNLVLLHISMRFLFFPLQVCVGYEGFILTLFFSQTYRLVCWFTYKDKVAENASHPGIMYWSKFQVSLQQSVLATYMYVHICKKMIICGYVDVKCIFI